MSWENFPKFKIQLTQKKCKPKQFLVVDDIKTNNYTNIYKSQIKYSFRTELWTKIQS